MSNIDPVGGLGVGGTGKLVPTVGQGGAGGSSPLTDARRKLRALMDALKDLMAFLPPELTGVLQGLLDSAEDALASGSLADVEALIAQFQDALDAARQIAQLMTASPGVAAAGDDDAYLQDQAAEGAFLDEFYRRQHIYLDFVNKLKMAAYGPKADIYHPDGGHPPEGADALQGLLDLRLG